MFASVYVYNFPKRKSNAINIIYYLVFNTQYTDSGIFEQSGVRISQHLLLLLQDIPRKIVNAGIEVGQELIEDI